MIFSVAVLSFLFQLLPSHSIPLDSKFIKVSLVFPSGDSADAMPERASLYFGSSKIRYTFVQVGFLSDSHNANYTDLSNYGMLKIRRLSGVNIFAYDIMFLEESINYYIYPSSRHMSTNIKRGCGEILISSVKYTVCGQKLSSLVGDSYGADVVPNDDRRQYTVEIKVHIDYSLYVKWLKLKNGDKKLALRAIKNYYSHVIHGVNSNYERINRPELAISVHLTQFYVDTTSSLFTSSRVDGTSEKVMVDAKVALNKASSWRLVQADDNVDAVIFFTNLDMNPSLGIAFRMAVCDKQAVTVISHHNQLELINLASHELGHILGAKHDGYDNDCPPNDLYIMSPNLDRVNKNNLAKTFLFSPCSIAFIKLRFMQLEMNNSNCLLNIATGKQDIFHDKLHIGQRLSIDEQCQLIYGPLSYNCGGENYCKELFCFRPGQNDCETNKRQTAADGSQCGNRKWCLKGSCEYDSEAPVSSKETCIHGDFSMKLYGGFGDMTCDKITETNSYVCYSPHVRSMCCETCQKFHNASFVGCEYGDKGIGCESQIFAHPASCRLQSVASKCCASCAKLYKEADFGSYDPSVSTEECEDGKYCGSIQASNCYLEVRKQSCCYTCKVFENTARKNCEYGNRGRTCDKQCSDLCCNNCTDDQLMTIF